MKITETIIHFLGGFTVFEYMTLNNEYTQQRVALNAMRERVNLLETVNVKLDSDRRETQRLFYERLGVLPTKESETEGSNEDYRVNPIELAPKRWSKLKVEMEKDDLNRVNSIKDDISA